MSNPEANNVVSPKAERALNWIVTVFAVVFAAGAWTSARDSDVSHVKDDVRDIKSHQDRIDAQQADVLLKLGILLERTDPNRHPQ